MNLCYLHTHFGVIHYEAIEMGLLPHPLNSLSAVQSVGCSENNYPARALLEKRSSRI